MMDSAKITTAIFTATNEIRLRFKLSLLVYSDILEKSALLHSSSMVQMNFFSHTNHFNKQFADVMKRVQHCKGNFNLVGENLAFHSFVKDGVIKITYPSLFRKSTSTYELLSPEEYGKGVVDAWMASPGHRANILNASYSFIGVGSVLTRKNIEGHSVPYAMVTQNFGAHLNYSLFSNFKNVGRTLYI